MFSLSNAGEKYYAVRIHSFVKCRRLCIFLTGSVYKTRIIIERNFMIMDNDFLLFARVFFGESFLPNTTYCLNLRVFKSVTAQPPENSYGRRKKVIFLGALSPPCANFGAPWRNCARRMSCVISTHASTHAADLRKKNIRLQKIVISTHASTHAAQLRKIINLEVFFACAEYALSHFAFACASSRIMTWN